MQNGDADEFAEVMQKVGYKQYGYSTKLDAEKHGYNGLTRVIPAAEVALLVRVHPPNSRSISGLQKNGSDAEHAAEPRADIRAVVCADSIAEPGSAM